MRTIAEIKADMRKIEAQMAAVLARDDYAAYDALDRLYEVLVDELWAAGGGDR